MPVLKPFSTDYCSEWPDGKSGQPKLWANCCFSHDLHYWLGGNQEQRKIADLDLRQCVKMTGEQLESYIMYIGVRMAGLPGNAVWAWGYGWTADKEYFELTKKEKIRAAELLKLSIHNKNSEKQKVINLFIENNLLKK